ncbi:hypothetical protein HanIR_Chr12g0609701 [Helianthus annuus]|nr:hypothetical protein HanIR_Chr12g0609701 [Helianthus annuus]
MKSSPAIDITKIYTNSRFKYRCQGPNKAQSRNHMYYPLFSFRQNRKILLLLHF